MSDDRNQDSRARHDTSHRIGVRAYGMAAIVLGVIGLISGDFATDWQRVPPNTLLREPLAYLTAFYEIGAGIAIFWRRSARLGALLLIYLYAIFTVLWIIQAVKVPWVYDGWGNVFEELSLVIGGLTAYAALAPPDSAWAGRVGVISRVFAVCPISFGIVHLLNLAVVAQWTPGWIPPGQMFWAIATAVFFFLAAASILLGIASHVAAALLTAEILGFEILVWLPKAIETPRSHFAWAGNGIGMAIGAAAWVVADALREPQRLKAKALAPALNIGTHGEPIG